MTTLSYGQMQTVLRSAGFTPAEAVTGSAIGMAESSGNPNAINYIPCVGFMQINVHSAPEYSISQLMTPEINAVAAHKIYKTQGWAAWTTYTSGAYKKYLPAANREIPPGGPHADTRAGQIGQNIGQQVSTTAGTLQTLSDLATKLGEPSTWGRVGYVLAGIVLIFMGIISMSASKGNLKLAAEMAKVAVIK